MVSNVRFIIASAIKRTSKKNTERNYRKSVDSLAPCVVRLEEPCWKSGQKKSCLPLSEGRRKKIKSSGVSLSVCAFSNQLQRFIDFRARPFIKRQHWQCVPWAEQAAAAFSPPEPFAKKASLSVNSAGRSFPWSLPSFRTNIFPLTFCLGAPNVIHRRN